MQSSATTVAGYIKSLPPERAAVIKEIRKLVNDNIPAGYQETMRWGMISWEIPLKKYPVTYNKQPLNYVGLAAQKNKYSLYLMSIYATDGTGKDFEKEYLASGKKMDVGKCCVRFSNSEDLPFTLIKKYIKKCTPAQYIKIYEASRGKKL